MARKLDLTIDCKGAKERIVDFLEEKVKKEEKNGIIFELSGGVDSAVVAHLAVLAAKDPRRVIALYLPDRDSDSKFSIYAQDVAAKLGISLYIVPIDREVKRENIYKPFIIRLTSSFPLLNRLFIWGSNKIIYPVIFRKSAFVVALERGSSAKNPLTKFIYRTMATPIEEGFSARHKARRRILEQYAKNMNLLLIGCANRSEAFVGWFVKDGVDDLPVETIMDLYKSQVYQMANYLGVPEKIIKVKPSPDMLKKIGDEDMIGHTYRQIDRVAFVAENHLNPRLAFDNGVTPKEFEEIMEIHKASEWKRANPHTYPKLG